MIREIYADKKALECLSLATSRHPVARNRCPLCPQKATFDGRCCAAPSRGWSGGLNTSLSGRLSPLLSPQGENAGEWACKGLETRHFRAAVFLLPARCCALCGAAQRRRPAVG